MKLFLGVDGGQSSTTALVGDETGRVLGMGRGGPCNHVGKAEGREKFLRAVGGCLRAAGFENAEFEAVCLGFSGGAADKNSYIRELIKAKHYVVTHDAFIALAGATAGEPGVIAIAGTGSIAFGRNQRGKNGARRWLGLRVRRRRAEGSISSGRRCGPRCGQRKDGVRRRCCARRWYPRPARPARTICCIVSIPTSIRGSAWRRLQSWWIGLRAMGTR